MSANVTLDVRVPIGAMFAVDGVVLTIHGLMKTPVGKAAESVGNVNLWWGVVLLVFGGGMLAWAFLGKSRKGAVAPPSP
jgi:hypothetical protein